MKKVILGLSSIIIVMLLASCFSLHPDDRSIISGKCVEIVSSLDVIPDGTIVLQDEIIRNIVLFDLQSDKQTLFEEAVFVMAVSPDNKQLAYTDEKTKQLVILSSTGEKKSIISVPEDWIGIVNWITSETILVEKFIDAPFGLASSIVYNLGTGEIVEYPSMEGDRNLPFELQPGQSAHFWIPVDVLKASLSVKLPKLVPMISRQI